MLPTGSLAGASRRSLLFVGSPEAVEQLELLFRGVRSGSRTRCRGDYEAAGSAGIRPEEHLHEGRTVTEMPSHASGMQGGVPEVPTGKRGPFWTATRRGSQARVLSGR